MRTHKYYNFILTLFIIILFSGISSAEIGNLKPTRTNSCIDLVQTDDEAVSCTLTFIRTPDGRINNIQKSMNALGNGSFNYTFCDTNLSGWYHANGKCNYNKSAWNYYFLVNLQGKEYSTVDGLVYIIVFIVLMSIIIFGIVSFINLPYDNNRSNEGLVVSINWKKYLKIFLGVMIYVMFIALNYFAWNISLGILEFEELGNFFKFMFRMSFSLMYPLFIVIVIWSVAQYIKDKKVEGFIERNLRFK